jgi:hypothetical protein
MYFSGGDKALVLQCRKEGSRGEARSVEYFETTYVALRGVGIDPLTEQVAARLLSRTAGGSDGRQDGGFPLAIRCNLPRAGWRALVFRAEPSNILPSNSDGLFFGTGESASGLDQFVTTSADGSVRLWPRSSADASQRECPRAQFVSDFVRVIAGGRPTALAFHSANGRTLYAVYYKDPPSIRLYDQTDPGSAELLMEHYPGRGLGTPDAMRFTLNGRCLEVTSRRKRLHSEVRERLRYSLVVDGEQLQDVAQALLADLQLPDGGASGKIDLTRYETALAHACGESPGKHMKDTGR